ncbi:MAG: helix-turn-helix transcriptional regulator [Desulfobacteraceae bacterium]|jgi:predicted transcriptional regulator
MAKNSLQKKGQPFLMTKEEFARKAGVAQSAVDRMEKGKTYVLDTKGKMIMALGYDLSTKDMIFYVE